MAQVAYDTPRRSSRVFMRVRVVVSGKSAQGKRFRETTESVVINAHGGLVILEHEVSDGALLTVSNPFTGEEEECRVVYLGDAGDKGQRVGLEFLAPCPHFWGVEFAPPDWTSPPAAPAAPSPA